MALPDWVFPTFPAGQTFGVKVTVQIQISNIHLKFLRVGPGHNANGRFPPSSDDNVYYPERPSPIKFVSGKFASGQLAAVNQSLDAPHDHHVRPGRVPLRHMSLGGSTRGMQTPSLL